MDTTDKNIKFDRDGRCNHCADAEIKLPNFIYSEIDEKENIKNLISRVKKRKSNSKYDSIIGLSGGVDSSYVAFIAYENGLNPLCVHFDNGWNSDIAVKNIKNIINTTGFDLHTEVINWKEFRDLQRSFLLAGVVDIEMLTDHAIFSSLYNKIKKFDIKTVLSGFNYVTEHGMPTSWTWSKMDFKNIKDIQKKFGTKSIKTFPHMSNLQWLVLRRFNFGGVFEDPLNFINFNREKVVDRLTSSFGWQNYGGKHHESVFTKFYQSYILPKKFNIDKRKVHLSCKIRLKEITRNEAIEILSCAEYNEDDLRRDKKFVSKKLGFSEEEFDKIISKEPIDHSYYKTDQHYIKLMIKFGKLLFGKGTIK